MATSDISFDPVSPTTADIVTITATVHNQRDDSFTNKPFKVSFYDRENLIGDDLIVRSIPPAGEVNASVEWYHPGSGTHNISVIVDSRYSVPETDDTNNEADKEVVVVPATIRTVDAVLALRMASGSIPTDPAADVDSDGAVTSFDALLILQYCKTQ
ncbi:MAG: CARDB domain-containing protein [Euryarchaeota archaeon]|nr:CARDB domain-containing protein [Euryarchaeota archaeon]